MKIVLAAIVIAGCTPDLDQHTSIVDRPEVLAVVAEPAEAAPGATVAYHALVATPDGEPATAPLAWAYCTDPKPPTDDDAVSVLCLSDPGVPLTVAADGVDATGAMPSDACMEFGPNPPGNGFRPRDPDPTGGYYQPVGVRGTVMGTDVTTFGLDRISCPLANAPPAIVTAYRARYHANQNPLALVLTLDGAAADGATVDAGATIAVHASWPAAAAEPYVSYDQTNVALDDRIESLRVSFYATAGAFDLDAAGVGEAQAASVTAVDDTWTSPSTPGPVTMWTVFRDSRGGATVARYAIIVR